MQKEKTDNQHKEFWLVKLYYQSIKNVPILKYSRILVACIFILALIAFFELKNSDVFYYAIGVILISFIGFLFSFLINTKDIFIRRLLYLLVSCIVVTMCAATLGFGSYIFLQKPAFYSQWFPDLSISDTSKKNIIIVDTMKKDSQVSKKEESGNNKSNGGPIKSLTSKSKIISIQLSQQSEGFINVLLNGIKINVLPESTTFNPRIEINETQIKGELIVITRTGDTCKTYLPSNISSDLIRIVPKCN
jgi:hypothetical protein